MEYPLFSEEHHIFRKTVKDFVAKEVTPHIDQWNEAGDTPRALWRRMGELGFLGAYLPEAYGGYSADFLAGVILTEEFVYSKCGGLSLDVNVSNDISVPYLLHCGSEEQKQRHLPLCASGECIVALCMTEPNAGSDLAAIRSTAIRQGDGYLVNAQKTFITNGGHADLYILAVKTDPAAKPAHRGVSLVLVEKGTPGFTVGRRLKKMGNHASSTAELSFEDVLIPAGNLLGKEGKGFVYMMQNLQQERLIGAVMALAYCRLMLKETLEYVKTRSAFGTPIGSFQANKHKLVEMATEVDFATVYVYHLCKLFNDGARNLETEISMAKYRVGELANRIAYECVQLHGGYGYMDEYWISRAYQDVRMLTIAAGTSEIMKEIIGRSLGL
jgi:acyl-CoA dehydrogenase